MNYQEWIHQFMMTFATWTGAGLGVEVIFIPIILIILFILDWIGKN